MSEEELIFEQQLKTLMLALRVYTEGVKAISLISESGLPIATVVREGEKVNENLIATLGSAALATGGRINIELTNGDLEKVIIQGKCGIFLVVECGSGALIILFNKYMNLPQLVFKDIKIIDEMRKKIAPILMGSD
ncbi:MAG: roadblock/LC7 domain-containing protein [Promethearchaeota archaeon]